LFVMFDQLMQSAQSRRIGLMREISVRREFAKRVRRVIRAAHGSDSLSSAVWTDLIRISVIRSVAWVTPYWRRRKRRIR
jgi:hypothetical protein